MAGSTTLDLWDTRLRGVLSWIAVTLERHELQLHGHRVSYRTAGSGPALLLLHGITNSSETWERAASLLSERFTLIAPDLLGHGESATPRGDYSLGAHASGARDVANALGHERVTVVGHSLGGGIAMQFAYQFPERTRAPGAGLQRRARPRGPPAAARRVAARRRLRAPRADLAPAASGSAAGSAVCSAASASQPSGDVGVLARGFASLDNAGSRQAFLHTVRAVIEPGGQRVSAERPARARRAAADADRVGRARLDHPRRARRRRARGDAGQPLRGLRRAPATCPTTTIPTASPRC